MVKRPDRSTYPDAKVAWVISPFCLLRNKLEISGATGTMLTCLDVVVYIDYSRSGPRTDLAPPTTGIRRLAMKYRPRPHRQLAAVLPRAAATFQAASCADSCLMLHTVAECNTGALTPPVNTACRHFPTIGDSDLIEALRYSRAGETGDPRENPPISGIIRTDSHMRKSGSDPERNRTRFALVGGEERCEIPPCRIEFHVRFKWWHNRAGRVIGVEDQVYATPHQFHMINGMFLWLHECQLNGLDGVLNVPDAASRNTSGTLVEPMGVIDASMEQCRNERAEETGDPRENPPTSGIVGHDFNLRKSGKDPQVGGADSEDYVRQRGRGKKLLWGEQSKTRAGALQDGRCDGRFGDQHLRN
ncbi:hypothetical protein PR048_002169 [Dryococelus australis]|uniref:Uncharacterized protein n=1 Tax=Dryococelus australis TaxID=614101 RepID=A0ABQ9IJF8_9NEOP|nr:hypothetical protein PR048_002169 [Dryococelus australis]